MSFALWLCWLCLFLPNGITGYTLDDLANKLENMESKLMSENEELRARVAALERLVSNCDCTEKQPIQIKEPNKHPVQEINPSVKQLRSNEKEFAKDQKRIGDFQIPIQLSKVWEKMLNNIKSLKNKSDLFYLSLIRCVVM